MSVVSIYLQKIITFQKNCGVGVYQKFTKGFDSLFLGLKINFNLCLSNKSSIV